jgi:hypothetical protein
VRTPRLALRLTAVVLAAAGALTVGPTSLAGPAAAQPDEPAAPPSGGMTLVDQSSFVEPTGTFELSVSLPGVFEPDDLLFLTVHEPVVDVADFERSLAGDDLGEVLYSVFGSAEELGAHPNGTGTLDLPIPLRDGVTPSPSEGALLTTGGVYPVRLSLRTSDQEVLGSIVTHIVRLPGVGAGLPRLPVATVVDLQAAPANGPGTEVAPGDIAAVNRWLRLIDTAAIPATLRITPWLLDAPGANRVIEDLRRVADGREVVGAPWTEIDEASLVDAGLADMAVEIWDRGRRALETQLGVTPRSDLWVEDVPPTRSRLTELSRLGINQLVLSPEALADPEVRFDRPVVVDMGAGTTTGLVDDGGAALAMERDPILGGHQAFAELSVRAFERAGSAVLLHHSRSDADPRAVAVLFDALVTSPIHEATTAGSIFDRFPAEPAGPLIEIRPRPVPELTGDLDQLDQARTSLAGYRSMVSDIDAARLHDPLYEDLLLTLSTGVDPGTRTTEWRQINARVLQEIEAVTPPPIASVQLTSLESTVPLPFSFQNGLDYPLRVEVTFISDKLTFVDLVDGDTATLVLEPGLNTEVFNVQALTSGTFPLQLEMRSPDGTLRLGDSRVQVRSTALSSIGIAIGIGAAAFLLIWWVLQMRRRRGSRGRSDEPMWRDPADALSGTARSATARSATARPTGAGT